ncbi:hypothetical protein C8R42DRAFT_153635 [Lentinula raphanica]|nr:hypothetical protein C8R42DRAFT_153635 [Lentinula raphanica]
MAGSASMSAGPSTSTSMHSTTGPGNSPSSPNIYITSPTATSGTQRYPPPITALSHPHVPNTSNPVGHNYSFASPGSSPTAPDFGANIHQPYPPGHSHGSHGHHQHPSMNRAHSFHHLQGHNGPFDSSRSGSPSGTGQSHPGSAQNLGDRASDMSLFDEMPPVGASQSGDGMNSASSSSVSVNLTGSTSGGDGHSPDDSSTSGLSASHGDGPGDEPGSQSVTGRNAKRQRMNVVDNAPAIGHGHDQEMMMSSPFGGMGGMNPNMLANMNNSQMIGMNGNPASSDSLLNMEGGMGNMSSHPMNMSLNSASLSPSENPKRFSTRARSDSAPLYHQQHLAASNSSSPVSLHGWGNVGRPRSGSGLGAIGNPQHHAGGPYGTNHMQRGLAIPSISMPRAGLNGGGMGVQSVPSNVQGQQGR